MISGMNRQKLVYLKKPGSLNQQDSSHNTYKSKIMNKQKFWAQKSSALTIIHKPSNIFKKNLIKGYITVYIDLIKYLS